MAKTTLGSRTATSPMMMYVICSFANDYSLLSARIVFRVSWLMSLHLWWEQDAGGAWKSHGALTSPRPFNVPVGKGHQPGRREHASKPAKQPRERARVFSEPSRLGSGRWPPVHVVIPSDNNPTTASKFPSANSSHYVTCTSTATQPKTSSQFNKPPLSPSKANPGDKLLCWRSYMHLYWHQPLSCMMSEKLRRTKVVSDLFIHVVQVGMKNYVYFTFWGLLKV